MRIGDIARLAGVSVSTVSKIVNGKDEGISAKTRDHVLNIVKEYNYRPYSTVIQNSSFKSFLFGFLTTGKDADNFVAETLKGIIARSRRDNYAVLVCESAGEIEQELKCITMLCRNQVEGVFLDGAIQENEAYEELLEKQNIPVVPIGSTREMSFAIDYRQLGYDAARILLEKGHIRIGCVCDPETESGALFWQGASQALLQSGISADGNQNVINPYHIDHKIFEKRLTAFISIDEKSAGEIKRLAHWQGLRTPEDITLLALCKAGENPFPGEISMLKLPLWEYGEAICEHLINLVEKRLEHDFYFSWEGLCPDSEVSICAPPDFSRKNILVVGSVNVDVLLNMDELPRIGKTVVARNLSTIPGGKGLNQAVGAAKLGANVSLIARVGADHEGAGIYMLLQDNKIDSRGLMRDESQNTGRAYIYVRPDGDSSIVVYAGANKNLTPEDIKKNEKLFETAGYCLLPLELSLETVGAALRMSKKYGVKTILKPTTMREIPDEFLKMVDYFVPNEAEADMLCPKIETVQEKAKHFLDKGAGTVIITLGAKGCYAANRKMERFYEAMRVRVVDTTGGADAFISALAVYLNEKYALDEAIAAAVKAASFCVSRHGTLPAMVDRTTLELYISNMLEKN